VKDLPNGGFDVAATAEPESKADVEYDQGSGVIRMQLVGREFDD